jgi:hypothetical protein
MKEIKRVVIAITLRNKYWNYLNVKDLAGRRKLKPMRICEGGFESRVTSDFQHFSKNNAHMASHMSCTWKFKKKKTFILALGRGIVVIASSSITKEKKFLPLCMYVFKNTLYYGRIRSHDPYVPKRRRYHWTMPPRPLHECLSLWLRKR